MLGGGVTRTRGTVLKGHGSRKVEIHCSNPSKFTVLGKSLSVETLKQEYMPGTVELVKSLWSGKSKVLWEHLLLMFC